MNNLLRLLLVTLIFMMSGCDGVEEKISVDSSVKNIEATVNDYSIPNVDFVITYSGSRGIYFAFDSTNEAINDIGFDKTSGRLIVSFSSPSDLGIGSYTDTVIFVSCYDRQCKQIVPGSPLEMTVNLEISEGDKRDNTDTPASKGSVSLISEHPEVNSSKLYSSQPPAYTASVQLSDASCDASLTYELKYSDDGISYAQYPSCDYSNNTINFGIEYKPADEFDSAGVYEDNVTLKVCYDYECKQELKGSPIVLHSSYTINYNLSDKDVAIPELSRTRLKHNVVDAGYSSRSNILMIASSKPSSTLYLYDLDHNRTGEIALNKKPTALSVFDTESSTTVAVSHDGLISYCAINKDDLNASTVSMLDGSEKAYDVVHTQYAVYTAPEEGEVIHKTTISDNNHSQSSGGNVDGKSILKLDTNGSFLYAYDGQLQKLSIGEDSAFTFLYGVETDCQASNDIWVGQNYPRVYMPCGNFLKISDNNEEDMKSAGSISLHETESWYKYHIDSLAESNSTVDAIAITEKKSICDADDDEDGCLSKLGLYSQQYYEHISTYTFGAINQDGKYYIEEPQYITYTKDQKLYTVTTTKDESNNIAYLIEVNLTQ